MSDIRLSRTFSDRETVANFSYKIDVFFEKNSIFFKIAKYGKFAVQCASIDIIS